MYEYISTIILNRVLNYSIIPLQLSATWDEANHTSLYQMSTKFTFLTPFYVFHL